MPKDSVVPLGWRLALTGIASLCDGLIGNISAPVVIVGRGKDTENGAEHLRIAWYRDASWHARIVEREILASVQKILAMAAFGLPVNSNNARLVVQYLADFEAANLDCLPMANVSHRMGYQGTDGRLGFLWGTTLITADGQQDFGDRSQLDPAEWARQAVHFQGADDGDDQIAAGFHAAGDYDEWKNAIQVLISFPKAKFALYAGLAAPLLPILHAPNFIVDDANETTSGKTVNLRVVASLFGNPDEESANGKPPAMFTWKGTSVWRERAPVVVNHLPFILDDSKHAKNNEDVAETIYTIAQGRGKGRGTTKGTAAQEGFSTVMLSSGEQPATSFTEDGGTRARVITVWGSPFGARNQETGRIVRQLNDKIKCHYGHAGPRFVQYILRNRKRWPRWRKLYQRFVELWENFAGDNAVAGRLAACFAAVSVAALLAHKSVDFPWQYEDPVGPLWDELVREASDRAAAALRYTMSWAAAHEEEFFGRRKIPSPPPTQGWAGRWDENVTDKAEDCCWSWIAFNPIRLNTVLTEGGFEPGSIIRTWRDRGWLRVEVDSDGTTRTHCRMRMGRENPRFVVILREAVAAVEDEDEEVVAEESDE